MITELYTFSPSSYVVAEEWNANFRTLYKVNVAHEEAITDAQAQVAFPNSDLTSLFSAVRNQLNSFAIPGNTVAIAPEYEYYKILSSGQDLVINIPDSMAGEARVLLNVQETRTLMPFIINYSGTQNISYGFYKYMYFRPGYYYVMLHVSNGLAQAKVIWTGV
jgi:hypothetical protein